MADVGISFRFQEAGAAQVSRQISQVARESRDLSAIYDTMGSAMSGAMTQVRAVLGAMNQVLDYGRAGAQALDIAAAYAKIGDAAPSIRELRDAVRGTVDETTMQQFATLASNLGLSAKESEGLAKRLTSLAAETGQAANTGDILINSLKGSPELFRSLGVAVDTSSAKFKGMGETQKKLAIIQEQANIGLKQQGDEALSAGQKFAQADAAMADFTSNLQTTTAEMLMASGALDGLSDIVQMLSGFVADNAETFEDVVYVVGTLLQPVLFQLKLALDYNMLVIKAVTFVLKGLIDGLGYVADAAKEAARAMDLFGSASKKGSGFSTQQMLFDAVERNNEKIKEASLKANEAAAAAWVGGWIDVAKREVRLLSTDVAEGLDSFSDSLDEAMNPKQAKELVRSMEDLNIAVDLLLGTWAIRDVWNDGLDAVGAYTAGVQAATDAQNEMIQSGLTLLRRMKTIPSTIIGGIVSVSDAAGKKIGEIEDTNREATMASMRAYAGAADSVLDAISPLADVAAFKAAIGIATETAESFAAFATGNIPGGIAHAAAAAKYLILQAVASSKGGSSASGGGSSSTASSTSSSAPPSALDRGGRESNQTFVFQVGQRKMGEISVGAINSAARGGTKLDKSIVGQTSTRRGRI